MSVKSLSILPMITSNEKPTNTNDFIQKVHVSQSFTSNDSDEVSLESPNSMHCQTISVFTSLEYSNDSHDGSLSDLFPEETSSPRIKETKNMTKASLSAKRKGLKAPAPMPIARYDLTIPLSRMGLERGFAPHSAVPGFSLQPFEKKHEDSSSAQPPNTTSALRIGESNDDDEDGDGDEYEEFGKHPSHFQVYI